MKNNEKMQRMHSYEAPKAEVIIVAMNDVLMTSGDVPTTVGITGTGIEFGTQNGQW